MNRAWLGTHGPPDLGLSVLFECPGCATIPDASGFHAVRVEGGGLQWGWNGSLERPTLDPSILVRWPHGEAQVPQVCHSFVRDGRIEFLGDCTHALAGQTVDLPERAP